MAFTTFTNYQPPAIRAEWLNDVNTLTYGINQPTGATLVGTSSGTLQAALDARPTSSALAAAATVPMMAYSAANIQNIFDNAVPLQNYTELRAYADRALGIRIKTSGIAGWFWRDVSDTTSLDNGGTIIVDALARRWKRLFVGAIFPRWFGAVGDGSASDTVAVQAAFTVAASLGVSTDLGGYSYNCASATLTCNCNVEGSGGTLRGFLIVSTSFKTLRNFKFISTNSARGIYLQGLSGARLSHIYLDNVRIECDPITTLAFRLGLYAEYIDDLRITNCYIFYGMQFTSCTNYLVHSSTLDGDNFQNPNELIHASYRSTGIISDNTFLNAHDNFIDIYSAGDRTVITGNRMIGCDMMLGTAIEVKVSLSDDPNNTSSATNGWDEQIIISDNIICDIVASINGNQRVINIYYVDNRSVPVFDWANTPRNIIVKDNIIDGYTKNGGVGVTQFTGIAVSTAWGINITGNIIRNINNDVVDGAAAGILVDGCHDIMVHGNKACVKDGSGLRFAGTCYDITVTGNDFGIDETAGHINYYGIYLSKIGSAPVFAGARLTISNNVLRASQDTLRSIAAAGQLVDSIFSNNICYQQITIQDVLRCTFANNWIYGDRFWVMGLGDATLICAHNKIMGNTFVSPSGTPKPGLFATRCRASIVSGNTVHTATNGIQLVGSSTAGECDNNIIKDNLSISQTGANFPQYSAINAGDQATIVADTNIMTT